MFGDDTGDAGLLIPYVSIIVSLLGYSYAGKFTEKKSLPKYIGRLVIWIASFLLQTILRKDTYSLLAAQRFLLWYVAIPNGTGLVQNPLYR